MLLRVRKLIHHPRSITFANRLSGAPASSAGCDGPCPRGQLIFCVRGQLAAPRTPQQSYPVRRRIAMKYIPFAVVLVALIPSPTYAQNAQFSDCRTLEVAGNNIGSDEALVNGMVCKAAKVNSFRKNRRNCETQGPPGNYRARDAAIQGKSRCNPARGCTDACASFRKNPPDGEPHGPPGNYRARDVAVEVESRSKRGRGRGDTSNRY
jgi:hypothetical protein